MGLDRAYLATRKMRPGTMGGQSRIASPVSPAVLPTTIGMASAVVEEPPAFDGCCTFDFEWLNGMERFFLAETGWGPLQLTSTCADPQYAVGTHFQTEGDPQGAMIFDSLSPTGIYSITLDSSAGDDSNLFWWQVSDGFTPDEYENEIITFGSFDGTEFFSVVSGSRVTFGTLNNGDVSGTFTICYEGEST